MISKDPDKYSSKKEERLRLKKQMNCGDYATITRYKNTDDISVTFDDGTVVEHRRYREFESGGIANPNNNKWANQRDSRLKETAFSKRGELMTIIDYVSSADITVQFKDGCIVEHRQYDAFKKGNIKNPNRKKTA